MPTLGQRIRAVRSERGLSQAELADGLVSPSYISLIESDRRSPERGLLEKMAQRLGCPTMYLETGIMPEEITEQRLRLQFAEIALANGATDEAREQFTELAALNIAEIRNAAMWGLARTEEALANLHGALDHLDVLLAISRSGAPGAPSLLDVLVGLCRVYVRAGDFARGIEVGETGLAEVRALGLEGTEEEVRLASVLVAAYWGRGDLFSAHRLAGQVIERADRLGVPTARGAAYWNACLVADARGQTAIALDLARKTLALMAETGHNRDLASIRTNYAWLLLRADPPDVDAAEELLGRAHAVLAELSLDTHLASCETEQARCALLRGDFAAAERIASDAIARCAEGGSVERQQALVVSGLALLMAGQVDEGAGTVRAAANRLTELGSQLDAAHVWRDFAEALLQQGRRDEAIEALRCAADSAGARSSSIPLEIAPAAVAESAHA